MSADDRKTNHQEGGRVALRRCSPPSFVERKRSVKMSNCTKKEAIRKITTCAQKYQNELNGNTLLFVCIDKHHYISYLEVSFKPENFMHLTGVKVIRKNENKDSMGENASINIAPTDFFNNCLKQRISPDDFEFARDGTTEMKLDVLPSIINKNLSAKMIGDYASTKPRLYTEKLAGGAKACMGFVAHASDGRFVPNTVLKSVIAT